MGDRQQAGKPSQYVTSHPGQLSLAISSWVDAMRISKKVGRILGVRLSIFRDFIIIC